MKKLISFLVGLFMIVSLSGQTTIYNDLILQKTTPMLHLYGPGAYINFYNGDLLLTRTANQLTLSGGNLSLGSNNLLLTGSIGLTGSRVLKGWFTDLELTNLPTIAGVSISSIFSPINSPTFTGTIVLPATTSIGNVSATELGYLDNVTSAIQTQLNLKAPIANPNFTGSVRLASDSLVTNTRFDEKFNYAIDTLIDGGVDLETFVDNKLENFVGGGGAVGMYQLRGIIDVTPGIPEDGDSLVFNSGFTEHPHLQVYRDGVMQWHIEGKSNTDGTQNAYVFDQDEGKIIVAPTFSAGEKLIINAFDPIIWTDLTPEGGSGGGGDPGASSLLTSLLASWSFDETAGTTANDNVGSNDGFISGGVVNQPGIFGKSILHDSQTDYIEVTNHSSLHPGDSLTVSMWFKLTSLPSAGDKNFFLIRHYYTSAQPWAYEIFINKSTNYIAFYVYNNSDTYFAAETNDNAVVADTWYNLICTIGAGTTPKIYLNNSDVTSYTDGGNFSGTIRTANIQDLYIGNALYDGTSAPMGYIDEVNIWSRIISSGERSSLQTKYYPFN